MTTAPTKPTVAGLVPLSAKDEEEKLEAVWMEAERQSPEAVAYRAALDALFAHLRARGDDAGKRLALAYESAVVTRIGVEMDLVLDRLVIGWRMGDEVDDGYRGWRTTRRTDLDIDGTVRNP